jgi:hypothetical protein
MQELLMDSNVLEKEEYVTFQEDKFVQFLMEMLTDGLTKEDLREQLVATTEFSGTLSGEEKKTVNFQIANHTQTVLVKEELVIFHKDIFAQFLTELIQDGHKRFG